MTTKHRKGYLYKRGNTYWIRYTIAGRRVRESLETTSLEEAEKRRKKKMRPLMAADRTEALAVIAGKLAEAKSEQAAADEEANPPLAISAAWDAYCASKKRPDSSERTLEGYGSSWKRFKVWLGDKHPETRQMRDISEKIAIEYAEHLEEERVSVSTFNQHMMLLKLVWRVLEKDIRGPCPWKEISRKKASAQKHAHRRKSLTQPQFEALLKNAGSADMHDLLFALAWTGQRRGDIVLLRWDSIDFKRKVITVHPMKTRRTGKAVYIPLLPALADLLKMRKKNAAGPHVFPELVADYERDPTSISKRISQAFTDAKLETTEHLPGVKRAVVQYGAHSLRHFFATQALSAGMPAEIVKRITGHASDEMLANYEHVDAKLIGQLASKLSSGQPALPAHNAPLPAWAVELVETLTPDNALEVKAALLKK